MTEVHIFAPSSPFDVTRFDRGQDILLQLGLTVIVPDEVRARHGFLAGSDAQRLAAFTRAWTDPSVTALLAARGGYGAHRLLPGLAGVPDPARPPLLLGFSDVTVLHAWAYARGTPTVHAPVVTQLGDLGPADHRRLNEVLTGPWTGLEYRADGPALVGGVAEGRAFGGCLSVITPLLGTPYWPDLSGAILLLEDVHEAPYRVDRLLTHLRLAGGLDRISGIGLGDFVGGRAVREGEPDVPDVLWERLSGLGVPVLAGLPFGHGARNQAIPLGVRVRLDADAGALTVLEDR